MNRRNGGFNPTKVVIPLTILMLFFTTIGYSLLETSLSIAGNGLFVITGDIRITSVSMTNSTGALENYNPTFTDNNIRLDFNLSTLTSTITYQIAVTNESLIRNRLASISKTNYSNNDIIYEIATLPNAAYVSSDSTTTLNITFKYRDNLGTLPLNTNLSANLGFNYEETAIPKNYNGNGLIMDLAGEDATVVENGVSKWMDRTSNNHDLTLTNVTFDRTINGYSFPGQNSCAMSSDTSIIPTTGDFTLQIAMENTELLTIADEAIVTQKIVGNSSDEGRFKPFGIANNVVRFWGRPNYFNYYDDQVLTGVMYYLTLVKRDNIMITYLDGIEKNRTAFPTGSFISSGTLQLGCFDGPTSQNFDGNIRAFKIYDHALTDLEIYNNYLYDFKKYPLIADYSLIDYAQSHYLASGNTSPGIYQDQVVDNRYVYRGSDVNNYVRIGGEIWRIIAFENDQTVKVFKPTLLNLAFDSDGYRTFNNNALPVEYCNKASTIVSGDTDRYGCNAFHKSTDLLNGVFDNNFRSGVVNNDSSLFNELNTTIYNSFNNEEKAMIKNNASFYFGPTASGTGTITLDQTYNDTRTYSYMGKIGTLDVYDVRASAMNLKTGYGYSGSYFTSYVSSTSFLWTMNGGKSNTYDVRVCNISGSNYTMDERRASRIKQNSTFFYAIPVVYINASGFVTGSGMAANPFVFTN